MEENQILEQQETQEKTEQLSEFAKAAMYFEQKRNGEVTDTSSFSSDTSLNEEAPTEPVTTTNDAVVPQETITFDETKFFEEKTGGKFKSWNEIETLINKEPEVKVVEPQFANEDAKTIYDAIANGKIQEVYSYLDAQVKVDKIKEAEPERAVKEYLKEQYPNLSEAHIERLYEKQFIVKEETYKNEFDEIDTLEYEIAKGIAQNNLLEMKQKAVDYFESKAKKIDLPKFEVQQQQPQQPKVEISQEVADSVISFVKSIEQNFDNEIAYKYTNPETKIELEGKFAFDDKKLKEIENEISKSPHVVLAQSYMTQDGELDVKKIAKERYILSQIPSMLQLAMAEGYNKAYIAKVLQDKNYKTNDQRPSGDVNVIDEETARVLAFQKLSGFRDEQMGLMK